MENINNHPIAILAAMQEELDILLPYVKILSKKTKLNFPIWKGELYGENIIIQLTGIGKVNAAMFAQHLISEHKVSHIYNFGGAGGISEKVEIGNIICATNTIQSDFDLTILGYKKGQIPKINKHYFPTFYKKVALKSLQNKYSIKFGNVVSADQFVADRQTVLKIGKEFKALAKDMESAAIGHVCYVNNIPFTAIKGISDNSGEFSIIEYQKYQKLATINCINLLLELIKNHKNNSND